MNSGLYRRGKLLSLLKEDYIISSGDSSMDEMDTELCERHKLSSAYYLTQKGNHRSSRTRKKKKTGIFAKEESSVDHGVRIGGRKKRRKEKVISDSWSGTSFCSVEDSFSNFYEMKGKEGRLSGIKKNEIMEAKNMAEKMGNKENTDIQVEKNEIMDVKNNAVEMRDEKKIDIEVENGITDATNMAEEMWNEEKIDIEDCVSQWFPVEFLPLDLYSLESTMDCVRLFKKKDLPLHILVNNASVFAVPYSKLPRQYNLH